MASLNLYNSDKYSPKDSDLPAFQGYGFYYMKSPPHKSKYYKYCSYGVITKAIRSFDSMKSDDIDWISNAFMQLT